VSAQWNPFRQDASAARAQSPERSVIESWLWEEHLPLFSAKLFLRQMIIAQNEQPGLRTDTKLSVIKGLRRRTEMLMVSISLGALIISLASLIISPA
jgi:hypothetical protein